MSRPVRLRALRLPGRNGLARIGRLILHLPAGLVAGVLVAWEESAYEEPARDHERRLRSVL